MTLSDSDVELFYKLMFQLQLYVNLHVGIFPDCRTVDDIKNLELTERIRLRDAVYANPELIDPFVKENPAGLDGDELEIVSSWSKFIAGDFFIERYLAKYAIFIMDETVYAVLALHDSFDQFAPKPYLPVYINTVLLPFKEKIIYDGVMSTHRIQFGGGIRGSLRETYLNAKQTGKIIETLDEKSRPTTKKRKEIIRDWRPEIDALFDQAQQLKSGKGTPAVQGEVFKLVKAALDLAKSSVHTPNDLDELWNRTRQVHLKLQNILKALEREE